jgi:hypothetical protein
MKVTISVLYFGLLTVITIRTRVIKAIGMTKQKTRNWKLPLAFLWIISQDGCCWYVYYLSLLHNRTPCLCCTNYIYIYCGLWCVYCQCISYGSFWAFIMIKNSKVEWKAQKRQSTKKTRLGSIWEGLIVVDNMT